MYNKYKHQDILISGYAKDTKKFFMVFVMCKNSLNIKDQSFKYFYTHAILNSSYIERHTPENYFIKGFENYNYETVIFDLNNKEVRDIFKQITNFSEEK